MAEIDIVRKRVLQPISCKCGRMITADDLGTRGDCIEIICRTCHSSLVEICIDLPEEDDPWD